MNWKQDYTSNFSVEWTNGIKPSGYEELRQLVEAKVCDMIQNNPDTFFNMLYLLDVDEQKIKQALKTDNPCQSVADIIINREIKKIETRLAYQNHFDNDVDDEERL